MLLKDLRKKKRYSQSELGQRIGVSRQTIGAWEANESPSISEEHLPALARLLGCKPEDLAAGEEKAKRKPRSDAGKPRRVSINPDTIRQALADVSKSRLSAVSGVSLKAIRAFEQGEGKPRLDTLRRLRDALKALQSSPSQRSEGAKKPRKPRKPRTDKGAVRQKAERPWWESLNEEPIPRSVIRANEGLRPSPIVGEHGGIPIRDLDTYALGQELAARRAALGVTEKELARHLGVSVWRIIDTETGTGAISPAEYEAALARLQA